MNKQIKKFIQSVLVDKISNWLQDLIIGKMKY